MFNHNGKRLHNYNVILLSNYINTYQTDKIQLLGYGTCFSATVFIRLGRTFRIILIYNLCFNNMGYLLIFAVINQKENAKFMFQIEVQ